MRIATPTETADGEHRVALVPKSAAQLIALGATVAVESGAGVAAGHPDAAYAAVGAEIVADAAALALSADVMLRVHRPLVAEVEQLRPGTTLIGILDPRGDPALLAPLLSRNITAFRMEAMPRISRAQDMDVLSSMSTVSGYRAAIVAAHRLPKIFPMLMTAAGTITPARALILGAGVAGLQAIATCRRLGAIVEAFDVRPAAREQVESLGARFVDVGVQAEHHEDAGGYATELDTDSQAREREALSARVREADIVIATAFVPNRPAPLLIDEAAVRGMRPGSVIVDMAAPAGGNCALTKPGHEVLVQGVVILGPLNLAAEMPSQASQLYSHNLTRFLTALIKDGELALDFDDVIVSATCMTHEGAMVAADLSDLMAATAS